MVDDGVDRGQPDLVSNLDMASGFDFGENDPDPIAEASGHACRPRWVLGARGNDGVGMAGVAWNDTGPLGCWAGSRALALLRGSVRRASNHAPSQHTLSSRARERRLARALRRE
jgi:hypothetical protein